MTFLRLLARFFAAAYFALVLHLERYYREWIIGLITIVSFAVVIGLLVAAPADFPSGQTIVIKEGTALPAIARKLAADRIIRHPRVFAFLVRLGGADTAVKAGPYRFAGPENLIDVAWRLVRGESGIPEIRITFIEGESVREMSAQVAAMFPEVSASDFIAEAGPYEGYLFPDTYLFSAGASSADIVAALRENFTKKVNSIEPLIQNSNHSLSDIAIMASLVQDEASNSADQKVIAGILWNRIAKGMRLQVDATFGYLEDEPEHAPTLSELAIDSPYNTYKYAGLPPSPIGNPGLSALEAAADPTETKYLYYLAGPDGQMHYATTYAGQLANERTYLK